MAVDLTGGFDEAREFVFATQPDDPEMRESVNTWIWDGTGAIGLPRIGIEAVADQWDTHDIQFQVVLPDGPTYLLHAPGEVHDPVGADGKPRILGAGPLSYELVKPFEHWRVRFDGMAFTSSVEDQIASRRPTGEPDTPIRIEIDVHAAAPPWENGRLLKEAQRVLDEQDEGALMGGPRFEQLNRAVGSVTVGDQELPIDGGALRIRRTGIRRLATFRGHAWQSGLFPSGKAFGLLVYPDREDGLPTYNEAFVYEGTGELIPAFVVESPWLRKLQPSGEPTRAVLETEDGTRHVIEGQTLLSCFSIIDLPAPMPSPVLQQAIVRYTMDGETANGMMERSLPKDTLSL